MRTPLALTPVAMARFGPGRWRPAAALALLAAVAALAAAAALLPATALAEGAALSPRRGDDQAAREAEVARQQRLQEAQVLAARGKKLVAERAFAEARDALREALRLNPDDAASRKLLGQAEAALGVANGNDVLAHTRESHAFKAQVLRQQIQLDLFEADRCLKAKEYDKAIQQAGRALAAAGQVDDARSALELRERAEKLVAEARTAAFAAAAVRRQGDLERAKAAAVTERTERSRDQAQGLRALRDQARKLLEAKEYDKAKDIVAEMLRTDPDSRDALLLRDQVREATQASLGWRGKSRERREGESALLAGIEKEMRPPKPDVVLSRDPKARRARLAAGPMEPWEAELRSKLATPVSVEFRETPVAQALEQLQNLGSVNIILDPEATTAHAPVTISRTRMPLEHMLRWVARFGNLQYCLRDGAIYLTGSGGTLDAPVTKIYDVTTLLSPGTTAEPVRGAGPIEPGPRPLQIVETASPDPEPIGRGWVEFIKSTIAPSTWDQTLQAAQPYTIQYRNGRIVVVHTPEVQRQVEDLLNDFRKARTLQVHMTGRFVTIDKRFLESLNLSFSYDNDVTVAPPLTPGVDAHDVTASMSPAPQVPSLTQFDAYGPTGGLGLRYSLLDDNSLVLLLKAVMNEGKGTVLEAPRLTCYNTQRANIQVLRNRNYVRRVSSDFTPEIGNIPEGTIFDIQPFVSADRRHITLVCQPQMRTFVSFTTFSYGVQTVQVSDDDTLDLIMVIQLPTTTLRSIGTTVTVPNGGTIVMGGFTTVEERSGIATAPLVEGIPLLRYLFRGRDIIEGRRSLIMMISAETVDDIFEEEEG